VGEFQVLPGSGSLNLSLCDGAAPVSNISNLPEWNVGTDPNASMMRLSARLDRGIRSAYRFRLVLATDHRVGEDNSGETSRMNRFFSKLDLRDIKIDPEGSRFPPDADESVAVETEPVPELQVVESPGEDEPPASLLEHDATLESGVQESPIHNGPAASDQQELHPIIQPEVILEDEPAMSPNGRALHGGAAGVIVGSDGEVLKVSARSRPSAVAGAIAGVVREAGRAEVQAIGAGATNQAVKAVAIARDYLRETGIDAVCVPAFIDVMIDNEERTAIRLVVEPR